MAVMESCRQCGAPREFDRSRFLFVCHHCGAEELAPEGQRLFTLGSQTGLGCPICEGAIHDAYVAGYPAQVCAACFGSLLRMDLLVDISNAVRLTKGPPLETLPPRTQQPDDRTIRCPLGTHQMISHVYGGPGNVVVDTCEVCRVLWLDPGELLRIALAPRGYIYSVQGRKGQPPTPVSADRPC
jgi:Zn-finger nucleic acid-binding protein